MDECTPFVIDNGSGAIKACFAGDGAPRVVIPSFVGRLHEEYRNEGREFYIGDDAQNLLDVLHRHYPIERGIITNWDDMEKIWNYIFQDEMRIFPEEHPIFLSESPSNSKENREKMAEIMFETFNVPGVCIENTASLAMLHSGYKTGIVLESGFGVTHAVPIYEGIVVRHAIEKLDIGGKDVDEYLLKLLLNKGIQLNNDEDTITKMKEKYCYVANNFEEELKSIENKTHTLSDGSNIILSNESIQCAELLFQPSIDNRDHCSIDKLLNNSINKCNIDIRGKLYSSIILAGGNTLLNNFPSIITDKMNLLANTNTVKVIAPPDRKYSVWYGGSFRASAEENNHLWTLKSKFEEEGPSSINK